MRSKPIGLLTLRFRLSLSNNWRFFFRHDFSDSRYVDHHARTAQLATRFASDFVADEVELRATHARALHELYFIYNWRIDGKYLLDANATCDAAHGEGAARFGAVFACEYQTFKRLKAGLSLFFNLLPDPNGVSRPNVEIFAGIHVYRRDFDCVFHVAMREHMRYAPAITFCALPNLRD